MLTPDLPLREVPQSLFPCVPDEPRECPTDVLARMPWAEQDAYYAARIEVFNARAAAYRRSAAAWLWILWLSSAVFAGLVLSLLVRIAL